jgi:hypothetical protein
MKQKAAIGVLFLLSLTMASQAGRFYGFFAWDQFPHNERAAYIAGSFDALITYASDDQGRRMGRHYSDCIERTRTSNGQLADNVQTYAKNHPEALGGVGSLQGALVLYLMQLCGKPPQ